MKVKLKSLCQNNEQQAKFCNDDIVEYIDVSSVNHSLKKIEKYTRYRFADAPSRARKLVRYGDVLVSTVRPNLNAVAICDERLNYPIVASTAFAILRARADVNPRFLYYCCLSNPFIQELCMQSTGANYPAVSESAVRNVYVNYYSRLEQDKLVSSLDRLGKCICALQGILQRLDSLIKARFVEMFGDVKSFVPLKHYIKALQAGKSLAGEKECIRHVLKTGAVSYDYFDNLQVKPLPEDFQPDENTIVTQGDVIISRMNTIELVGAAAYVWNVDDNTFLPDRLWKASIHEGINPIFVWQLLIQPTTKEQIRRYASGTSGSMKNISKSALLNIPVVAIPCSEQAAFAAFVEQVDKSKVVVQKALDKAQQLYDSLMQQYFD